MVFPAEFIIYLALMRFSGLIKYISYSDHHCAHKSVTYFINAIAVNVAMRCGKRANKMITFIDVNIKLRLNTLS